MISGGLRSKVFILQQGGYDTHSAQVGSDPSIGRHATLLTELSDAIFAFQEDLKLLSLEESCLLYTSPSPRDRTRSRMPSSA